jgi:pectinesterase
MNPAPAGTRHLVALVFLVLGPLLGAASRPDVIVAADGTGQHTSVQDAISAAPQRDPRGPPWVILVKAGTYRERIYVQRERGNLLLQGEGADRTEIVFNLHAGLPGPDGKPIGTFRTPTLQIDGDGFEMRDLAVRNDAGPVGQALALRADGDRLVFRRCRFLGWQDTVLANRGRHYFEEAYIEGHVDFIFGGATAYFRNCRIHVLKDGYLTAASTPPDQAHGFVFDRCVVTAEPGVKAYLGRPWRIHAATVFLHTEFPDAIRPEGWHDWNKPEAHATVRYGEIGNTGAGSSLEARPAWVRRLTNAEAAALTPAAVLAGPDGWTP